MPPEIVGGLISVRGRKYCCRPAENIPCSALVDRDAVFFGGCRTANQTGSVRRAADARI